MILTSDLSSAKSARLSRFRALLLLDGALYLDTALRWELGAGFARPVWLGTALGVMLVFALLDRFVESKLFQGLLTFPLWCWAFMMAGTGNPYFDWHSVPVVHFFRTSWLDHWLDDGGFLTAGVAAAAHATLAPRWLSRPNQGSPPPAHGPRRTVAALLVAACVVLLPVVELRVAVPGPGDPAYVVRIDPRDPSGVVRPRVIWLRCGTWALLVLAGLVWMRKVRREADERAR